MSTETASRKLTPAAIERKLVKATKLAAEAAELMREVYATTEPSYENRYQGGPRRYEYAQATTAAERAVDALRAL